jgi:hypothetical protein
LNAGTIIEIFTRVLFASPGLWAKEGPLDSWNFEAGLPSRGD